MQLLIFIKLGFFGESTKRLMGSIIIFYIAVYQHQDLREDFKFTERHLKLWSTPVGLLKRPLPPWGPCSCQDGQHEQVAGMQLESPPLYNPPPPQAP